VACIPLDAANVESRETLWAKYRRLQAEARRRRCERDATRGVIRRAR
jgi:hypothetical protein